MKTDAVIRRIHEDELPALLELYTHLHPSDDPLPDRKTLQKVWTSIYGDPRIECLVAEADDRLIGTCVLVVVPNLTRGARPYGLIENVVTHPSHRGRGVGTRLLQYALDAAWARNCYKVMLLTGSRREETLRFYERTGFQRNVKTGFIAYPAGDGRVGS